MKHIEDSGAFGELTSSDDKREASNLYELIDKVLTQWKDIKE